MSEPFFFEKYFTDTTEEVHISSNKEIVAFSSPEEEGVVLSDAPIMNNFEVLYHLAHVLTFENWNYVMTNQFMYALLQNETRTYSLTASNDAGETLVIIKNVSLLEEKIFNSKP